MDSIFSIIKNDSQSELAALLVYPYSQDSTLDPTKLSKKVFDSLDWQLQENPTFISVCAFYGSIRCFNLLLANGADLHKKDNKGIRLFLFLL